LLQALKKVYCREVVKGTIFPPPLDVSELTSPIPAESECVEDTKPSVTPKVKSSALYYSYTAESYQNPVKKIVTKKSPTV
jgi:hypothetical protein